MSKAPSQPRASSERPRSSLAFGTSGIRGLVTELTDLEVYVNTRGFLDYLGRTDGLGAGSPVAIAGDLRPSTDGRERSIVRAVVRAIADAGFTVVNCGHVPTPALSYFAFQKGWPSIMVTGSHIPFDRNGIKLYRASGEVRKTDEASILAAARQFRDLEWGRLPSDSQFDRDGMFQNPSIRPAEIVSEASVVEAYISRYLQFFPDLALQGRRVLVYEHSAVGREILCRVLHRLGAEVLPMGRTSEFVPLDTEAITVSQLAQMQELIDEARSRLGEIDALVSTDGDSDRPLLLGVDETGRAKFYSGDLLGILTAEYLCAEVVAVPVTATDAVESHFEPRHVACIRTRVGSPWVIAAMAEHPNQRAVAWEANGGFLTFSSMEVEGRHLEPLPTRDAVLPIVSVLHMANQRRTSVGRLFDRLPRRFVRSGLVDGVSEIQRRSLAAHLCMDRGLSSVAFDVNGGQVLEVAPSDFGRLPGTSERLLRLRDHLAGHFNLERGFDGVAGINLVDGVRAIFRNGEIVHLRASGNAPQFRVYAVAQDQDRADRIVRMVTDEPNGIFRSMLAAAGGRSTT